MIRKCLGAFIISSVFVDFVQMDYLPILFWHSAGESCCGDEAKTYIDFIKQQMGNEVYIKSVQIGQSPAIDVVRSLMDHPFEQIKDVCNVIKSDSKFANGYNGIGLSQGGLFLRGLAQVCPNPPMKNCISLGGPQQGVHQFPRCAKKFGSFCGIMQSSINTLAYSWPFQGIVAPSTYWHDLDEERYRKGSTFLAVINNEKEYNANYVINLHNLKRLILVKYEKDESVIPNETAWFGYYNEKGVEVPLEQTKVYLGDRLGLQALKETGRLIFLLSPREHLELDPAWFRQNILPFFMET